MQNSTLVWIIIIALVILGAGWYLFSNQPIAPANVDQNTDIEQGMLVPGTEGGLAADTEVIEDTSVNSAPMSAAVTYSANGFSPSTVTVKVGGTVTWANSSGGNMWVASAQHPTHTVYSGTTLQEHCDTMSNDSFDQCANGNTYSFTFDKVGTWRYHNHSNSSHFGSVVVVE